MTPRLHQEPNAWSVGGAWELIHDAVRAYLAAKAWKPGDPGRPQRPRYGKRPWDRPLWSIALFHVVVRPVGLAVWLLVVVFCLWVAQRCGVQIPKVLLP